MEFPNPQTFLVDLRRYKEALLKRIEKVEKLERDITELMAGEPILGLTQMLNGTAPVAEATKPIVSDARPGTLKERIELVVRESNQPMSVEEVKQELIDRGFAQDRENLYNTVYSALSKDKDRYRKTGPATYTLAGSPGEETKADQHP